MSEVLREKEIIMSQVDGPNNLQSAIKAIAALGGDAIKVDTQNELSRLTSIFNSGMLNGKKLSDEDKMYIQGLIVESGQSLAQVNDTGKEVNNEPLAEQVSENSQKDAIVENFKALDKDGDLKVSAKEYTDSIVAEYMNSGELPAGYDNIADYLNAKFEEFKRFAGDDVSMNIDEFRSMFEARLNAAKEAKEMQKPPTETVNTQSTKESTPEKNADGRAINPDHPNTEALPNTPVEQAVSTPDKTKDGEEI